MRASTADWTGQQFRATITGEAAYRFLIHDRDAILAPAVDDAGEAMGLSVLKTAGEDAAGERQLRPILQAWVRHDNRGRPQTSLGPGLPAPSPAAPPPRPGGHRFPASHRVVATPILGGLHHEDRLEREAA